MGLAHGEVMTRGELFGFIILLLSFGLLASFMGKCCLFLDVEKPCRSDLDLISNHHDNWEHETVSDLSFPFCYKITPHHVNKRGSSKLKEDVHYLGSMGIYVIKRDVMMKLLTECFSKANDFLSEVIAGAISPRNSYRFSRNFETVH